MFAWNEFVEIIKTFFGWNEVEDSRDEFSDMWIDIGGEG